MANNDEINLNRDWSVNINLSGIAAPTGNKVMDIPEGYYKVKISDMYTNPERNPNRVIIKLTVQDSPFTGVIRTDGLNMPKSDDDKVRYYWRGLAESVGYTPAQLDGGAIQITRESFMDKTAHIHYTPKGNGSEYDKTEYLAPVEWSQQKQMFDANKAASAGQSAAPASNGASKPLTNGAGTTTKADVLSKLGL